MAGIGRDSGCGGVVCGVMYGGMGVWEGIVFPHISTRPHNTGDLKMALEEGEIVNGKKEGPWTVYYANPISGHSPRIN